MCGFAGWVDRPGLVSRSIVEAMAATLSHRGPDGSDAWSDEAGCAAMAHRRLAILDLSSAAAQPLANEDGSLRLVFNGEIYNYRQLRTELKRTGHRFRSATDSEVIVHGWEEWGTVELLSRLRGMFAFALWNDAERRLLLARDRFGIKPLYLATLPGGGCAFASEAKGLLVHPAISRRPDPAGLRAYLAYGYAPAETSMFTGIRKLRAGWLLEWSEGDERERRYWDLEYNPQSPPATVDDAAAELRVLLTESVRLRLHADVPVGSFLSGGIDSSTVTTIATSEHHSPLATFCIAFPEMHDEDIHYAKLVAERLGTAHHERALRGDEARDLVVRMPVVLDEPLYDPSVYPTYLVARLARQSVKVALSGTGGDEVFAGYGWLSSQLGYAAQRQRLGGLAAPMGAVFSRLLPLLRDLPPGNRLPGVSKVLGCDQAERSFYLRGFFDAWDQRRLLADPLLRPSELDEHLWLYRRFARPDWPLVPRLMLHDLKALITDNELTLLDRATMAHGLEGRLPLLDHVLVQRVFSFPWHYLFADGEGKRVLRSAVKPLLPEEVLQRAKYGFSPPFKRWLREGALARTAAGLTRGRLVEDGVISAAGMRRTLARGALRRLNKTWLLLNLEMWYRQWIRNEPVVPSGTPLNAL